jgi:endoglycosylceramidase
VIALRAGGRVLAVLAAIAMVGALAAGPAAAAVRPGQLGHVGRWYTDEHGRVRILHGLNVVAKRAPYLPSAIGIGEDDAAFMARQGFNTIRLGVIYTAVEPRPGVYDDGYLGRIARTVRTFRRHGIYSLLDFHQDQYSERFQGQGFPDWAVLDDGLPAEPKSGFPLNYYFMPALQRTYDNFWANRRGPGGVGVQTRYAAAWRHVAARFRDRRGVMGYDLMNEPFPGSGVRACFSAAGCRRFERGRLSEFSRRMLRAIRSADRSGLVHYEPATSFGFLGTAPSFHRPLRDPAVAFSWHLYCFEGLSLAGARKIDDCPAYERHAFGRADRQARRDRAPQLLSEFGSTSDLGLIDRVAAAADRARVSWQEWTYHSNGITDSPGTPQLVLDPRQPPTGDNVDRAQLGALVRPYPRIVAGTPTRFRFRPAAHRFDLRFSTRLPSGRRAAPGLRSEVFIPRSDFPGGYRARVAGAVIVSRPGVSHLRLIRCEGVARVRLTITRGTGVRDDGCRRAVSGR